MVILLFHRHAPRGWTKAISIPVVKVARRQSPSLYTLVSQKSVRPITLDRYSNFGIWANATLMGTTPEGMDEGDTGHWDTEGLQWSM